jgi:hypothetical protein
VSHADDLTGRHGKNREAARKQGRGDRRARVVEELRRARPVARTLLKPGTVVWARVPFVDRPDSSKARPAVVSEVVGREVRLLPVTSSTKESVRRSPLYVRLEDWASAGLSRPCLVTRKVISVDVIDITTVVGCLGDDDRARVLGNGADSVTP